MGLSIRKIGEKYEAVVTRPHMNEEWRTSVPLSLRELINELQARGCHQQDIADVLDELDPDWLLRLNEE